jgi:hypothetical protein
MAGDFHYNILRVKNGYVLTAMTVGDPLLCNPPEQSPQQYVYGTIQGVINAIIEREGIKAAK